MLSVQTLNNYLEELLESSSFKDYCPNGLQVEGKQAVRSIATAVSANLATIEKAIDQQADVLIVHHGLFWKGDSYCIEGSKKKKLQLLLDHNISLFAYHLPLDAHQEVGNNWKAARDLSWENLEPFGYFNGIPLGVKGSFKECSVEDFQKSLENYYQHPAHSALGGKKTVQTAGLISGGAYKSLQSAAEEGLDCFITGNFDEPAWYTAQEERINFFAMGHSATEVIGPKTLGEKIKNDLEVDTSFLDVPNPF